MSVGASVAHDSALKHATGEAQYVDDLPEPRGLLHAAFVTSPLAHGRLLGVDAAPALALSGVRAVLTAADIPGLNDIAPILKDEPLLAVDSLCHVGQPVAVVVADSHDGALAAARAVSVQAEPLPACLDVAEALAAGSFVAKPMLMLRGDAAAALAAAPQVVEGELRVGGQDHFYLETQVALAMPQEGGDMLVLSSTQHPTEVQHLVAAVLGLPQHAVVVETRRLGGAFGGKESQASLIACAAALAARRTGRPVKLRLCRDDDMVITGKRHPFLVRWRAGVDGDGGIVGVEMVLAADAGWSCDLSLPVVSRALSHADNAYYYPAVRLEGYACRTNKQSNTAFRGFGAPQGMIAAEAMMDQIARTLGLDPLAVRRRNFYGPGRDLTPYGQQVEHFRLPAMVDRLADQAGLEARRRAVADFNAANTVLKKGLALSPVKFGVSFNNVMMNQAGALVHVYTDGTVMLNHGGIEMGQGLYTKVAQVVAETFAIPLERVRVTATSTAKVPNTSPTAASSGSDLNGMAARAAALTIRERMAQVAAGRLGVAEAEVSFRDGAAWAGERGIGFAELAELCHRERVSLSSTGYYRTPKIHFDPASMQGRPFYYYAHGLALSEVAVDTLTGEWRLLAVDILHDVGASLNPALDKGQVEGGFAQGMGWLTMEELVWDADGRLRTHAPSTYKIPTARDLPEHFRVELLPDAPNAEETIFRSKAVGEPPLMLAISVWLALRDAVAACGGSGPVDLDAPATPERLLAAIGKRRRA